MFTGMLHTHKLVVILFLLLYVVKTTLLLLNKTELLETVKKKTRIFEMVISTLFLVTGLYMIFNIPTINQFMVIKLVCVFASIPVAVIGFKKNNKALAALSLVMIIAAYGLAEMSKKPVKKEIVEVSNNEDLGKAIYDANCKSCHGDDGKLGLSGAKDLSASTLTSEGLTAQITNGKNAMPAYGTVLKGEEIKAVTEYVQTLKK